VFARSSLATPRTDERNADIVVDPRSARPVLPKAPFSATGSASVAEARVKV
jgi:hypothetical protein